MRPHSLHGCLHGLNSRWYNPNSPNSCRSAPNSLNGHFIFKLAWGFCLRVWVSRWNTTPAAKWFQKTSPDKNVPTQCCAMSHSRGALHTMPWSYTGRQLRDHVLRSPIRRKHRELLRVHAGPQPRQAWLDATVCTTDHSQGSQPDGTRLSCFSSKECDDIWGQHNRKNLPGTQTNEAVSLENKAKAVLRLDRSPIRPGLYRLIFWVDSPTKTGFWCIRGRAAEILACFGVGQAPFS